MYKFLNLKISHFKLDAFFELLIIWYFLESGREYLLIIKTISHKLNQV